jgi:hypothetical protein
MLMGFVNWKYAGLLLSSAVVLAVLLAGCGEDNTIIREVIVEVPGECEDMGDFVLMFPPIGNNDFEAVWGTSDSNIFAVGDDGVIAHFDGTSWELMNSGVMRDLDGIWGTSANNVYAVGSSGLILHYDGSTWENVFSRTTNFLYDVWGTSTDNIYCSDGAYFYHYDGDGWSQSPYLGSWYSVYAMWGSSPNNIFAFASSGMVYHYVGSEWTDIKDQ